MLIAVTRSATETREVAAALAEVVQPGDLLLLAGEMGAGKTAFTQGFGWALGIDEPITSPTFTLHRQYQGRLELNHLDVYRLGQLEEVLDIGLPELLDTPAVTVIEWGDVISPAVPADYLEIRLQFGEEDDDRIIEIEFVGSRWSARSRALTTALASWTVTPEEASLLARSAVDPLRIGDIDDPEGV